MPKPITLAIEVEEIALGPVWRKLKIMPGVVSIKFTETNWTPKPRHLNGARSKPFGNSRLALLALMADGKPQPRSALRDQWTAQTSGSPSTWHNTSYNARRDGLIKAPKPGVFQITKTGLEHLARKDNQGE